MKKRMIFYLVFFACFLLTFQRVSASFACGQVEVNEGDFVPSWLNVEVYYNEKPLNVTSCKVSPDDLKFCCDLLDIKTVNWQVGKTVSANVLDLENGYFSLPSSTFVSGEGFDVFQILNAQKGIDLVYPEKKAFLEVNDLELYLTSADVFDNIGANLSLENFSILNFSCNDCNDLNISLIDLEYGFYKFDSKVENELYSFSESFNFTLLEDIDFFRVFDCAGCPQTRFRPEQRVNVSVDMNLSHHASGRLLEIIPKEFEAISDEGVLEPFSDTHNALVWEVDGSEIRRNYTLIMPDRFFSARYLMKSSFEGIDGNEKEIVVSRFWILDFFSKLRKMATPNENLSEIKFFPKVSVIEPLVYDPIADYVDELAIFTKNYNKNVYLKFSDRFIPLEFEDEIGGEYKIFSFSTNINYEKITNVSFKFKLNNSEYTNPHFYFLNKRNFSLLASKKYLEEEEFSYYFVRNNVPGFYAIIDEGENE